MSRNRSARATPDEPRCDCACSSADAGDEAYETVGPSAEGPVMTPAGEIPRVPAALSRADRWGTCRVRWGIRRMSYSLHPGLYAVGHPDERSPVLVSANYKLSFDTLRRELDGLDAWVLVLDTKGINVWCAAGKGTFGTDELVRRVDAVGLKRIVSHRKLIVPQLGAPGVAAHEVQARTGFRVVFGPVRAADIKTFLKNGLTATPDMRKVRFGFLDRLELVAVELANSVPLLLIGLAVLLGLSLLAGGRVRGRDIILLSGSILAGTVVAPQLLPWIPGRAFSWKGWLLGALGVLAVLAVQSSGFSRPVHWPTAAAWMLIYPAISAFLAMGFTGSSTFTSLSGVVKEMKYAVPMIFGSWLAGLGLLILSLAVRF